MSKVDQIKVGDRYGHWTVLKERNKKRVLCQCDCENKTIKEVNIYQLLKGRSTSCGCAKQKYHIKVGDKYNHLTVLELNVKKNKQGSFKHKCQCDCENKTIYYATSFELVKGKLKSCGCAHFKRKHNEAGTRFYRIWTGMKQRCKNPNFCYYCNYGGRGISLCKKWESYDGFREDMFESYQQHIEEYGEKDTTLDRIDNDGDYCKENCHWATLIEQASNTRKIKYLTDAKGETHTIREWANIKGLNIATIKNRINNYKWSVEDALNRPARKINYKLSNKKE